MAKVAGIKGKARKSVAKGTELANGNRQITLVLTAKQFRSTSTYAKKYDLSFADAVRQAVQKLYVA
jgi:hypothetical protein